MQTLIERNLAIIERRKNSPGLSLKQVGDEFDITKERVRQILSSAGMPTRHHTHEKVSHCLRCGAEIKNRSYCRKCQFELHNVELICDNCGIKFWRRVSAVLKYASRKTSYGANSKYTFCSRHCLGVWRGKKYGSGAQQKARNDLFKKVLKNGGIRIPVVAHRVGSPWQHVFAEFDGNTVVKLITDVSYGSIKSALYHHNIKATIYRFDDQIYIDGRLKNAANN